MVGKNSLTANSHLKYIQKHHEHQVFHFGFLEDDFTFFVSYNMIIVLQQPGYTLFIDLFLIFLSITSLIRKEI